MISSTINQLVQRREDTLSELTYSNETLKDLNIELEEEIPGHIEEMAKLYLKIGGDHQVLQGIFENL